MWTGALACCVITDDTYTVHLQNTDNEACHLYEILSLSTMSGVSLSLCLWLSLTTTPLCFPTSTYQVHFAFTAPLQSS